MTRSTRHPEARNQAGFTLIEVLLAVGITAVVMFKVGAAFLVTLQARTEIQALTESTADGERVLTLIERDLRALWHHNIKDNRVLIGRDQNIGGFDADRIDFLCSTNSVSGALDTTDQVSYPSICEVGYWLKPNPEIPGLIELYRREDPLIDNDLQSQGRFQLVCGRIKDFNITYFETLGHQAEELHEWDSSQENRLPRRIKIEFQVHRKLANRNRVSGAEVEDFGKIIKRYERHIVFDRRYTDILTAGVAMVPVAPPPPEAEALGGGGPQGDGDGGAGPADGATTNGAAGAGGGFIAGGARTETSLGGGQGTRGPGGRGGQSSNPGANPIGGGNPPPNIPPSNDNGVPIDLGDLLRGGGLRGNGGGIFGGN